MKVVAVNGSPRAEGNTFAMLSKVKEVLVAEEISTDIVQLGKRKISGCTDCHKCFENANRQCSVKNDVFNEIAEQIFDADGLLIGSPTYFTDVTAETKALIDRVGLVSRANGFLLKHKVGAAVVAVRRGGGIHTFDTINHLFSISQMFIVGSTYWNLGYGRNPGEVLNDEEGMNNMQDLGASMAFLLKKLHG